MCKHEASHRSHQQPAGLGPGNGELPDISGGVLSEALKGYSTLSHPVARFFGSPSLYLPETVLSTMHPQARTSQMQGLISKVCKGNEG